MQGNPAPPLSTQNLKGLGFREAPNDTVVFRFFSTPPLPLKPDQDIQLITKPAQTLCKASFGAFMSQFTVINMDFHVMLQFRVS